jgi:hypothetical protein
LAVCTFCAFRCARRITLRISFDAEFANREHRPSRTAPNFAQLQSKALFPAMVVVVVMRCVVLRGGLLSSLRAFREECPGLEVGAQLGGVFDHVLRVAVDVGLRAVESLGVFEHGISVVLNL